MCMCLIIRRAIHWSSSTITRPSVCLLLKLLTRVWLRVWLLPLSLWVTRSNDHVSWRFSCAATRPLKMRLNWSILRVGGVQHARGKKTLNYVNPLTASWTVNGVWNFAVLTRDVTSLVVPAYTVGHTGSTGLTGARWKVWRVESGHKSCSVCSRLQRTEVPSTGGASRVDMSIKCIVWSFACKFVCKDQPYKSFTRKCT